MRRIFLHFPLFLAMLLLAGCANDEMRKVDLPPDVAAVTEPFLAAIKKGDRATAEKMVDRYMLDDTQKQFEPAYRDLEASPALIPVVYRQKPGTFGADKNSVTVIYVARKQKDWITATLRLGRLEGEPFKIEYWDVVYSNGPPRMMEAAKEVRWVLIGLFTAMAAAGLALLGLILWIVKRRPRLIVVDNSDDKRAAAVTTRDES